MARDLSILNGGDLVGLNGFVKDIVLNTIIGMLGSLRDVDVSREIRITISASKQSQSSPDSTG